MSSTQTISLDALHPKRPASPKQNQTPRTLETSENSAFEPTNPDAIIAASRLADANVPDGGYVGFHLLVLKIYQFASFIPLSSEAIPNWQNTHISSTPKAFPDKQPLTPFLLGLGSNFCLRHVDILVRRNNLFMGYHASSTRRKKAFVSLYYFIYGLFGLCVDIFLCTCKCRTHSKDWSKIYCSCWGSSPWRWKYSERIYDEECWWVIC